MHIPRFAPLTLAVTALFVLAGCTSTVDGTGSRGGGAPSATDFPSTASTDPTSSPTDPPSASSSSGGGSDDAADLVRQMVDAMTSREQGFALQGEFDDDGDAVDLDLRMAGDDGSGTITIGDQRCELVNVGGDGYAKAPASFWSGDFDIPAATAAKIDDRWVELSGTLSGLLVFVDASTFLDAVASDSDDYTLGDTATKQGVDAQAVEDDDTTLYISVDEPHLLLEVADEDGPVEVTYPDDDLAVETPAGAIPYPG